MFSMTSLRHAAIAAASIALLSKTGLSEDFSTPVFPDGTIRPYGSNKCVRKYDSKVTPTYAEGDRLALSDCQFNEESYQWEYSAFSGKIKSVGESSLCWNVDKVTYSQTVVKLAPCADGGADAEGTRWDYVDGRFVLRRAAGSANGGEADICIGFKHTDGEDARLYSALELFQKKRVKSTNFTAFTAFAVSSVFAIL